MILMLLLSLQAVDEDAIAGARYEEARKFEEGNPKALDQIIAKYRAISWSWPTSSWAGLARERYLLLEESIAVRVGREFEAVRTAADEACGKGDYAGALKAVDRCIASATDAGLKRRAEVERVRVENRMRTAFNDAVAGAVKLAAAGKHEEAAALVEKVAAGVTPELAATCREEAGRIRTAKGASAGATKIASEAGLRESAAKLLPALRARDFDAALAGLKDPEAALMPLVEDERAAIRAAGDVWKAVNTGIKARLGTDISLILADRTRVVGRLSKADAGSVQVEIPDGVKTVKLTDLHHDQLILFAFGRGGLADPPPQGCLKAAMFFYYAGNDALAKLHLATAKELGADIAKFEKVWREGLLRSAMK